jgi:hypothetical protein
MIKMLVIFLSLFIICFCGIEIFRKLTSKEKWQTIKTISYSIAISGLVIIFLTVLVVLF